MVVRLSFALQNLMNNSQRKIIIFFTIFHHGYPAATATCIYEGGMITLF